MRLFAALQLPPALAPQLAAVLPQAPSGARPVPAERWHLTLAFFGAIDTSGLHCLTQKLGRRLAALAPAPPLVLRAAGGGVFRGGAAHVALGGATEADDDRLCSIAEVCRRSGLACGAPGVSQGERFRPHLTIARFRRGEQATKAYRAALRAVSAGPWTCGCVQLVESFLGPSPRYEIRADFPLPPG